MKKYYVIILLVSISVFFSSCSEYVDSNGIPYANENIDIQNEIWDIDAQMEAPPISESISEWVISEPLRVRSDLENIITMELLEVRQETNRVNQVSVKIINHTEYRLQSTLNVSTMLPKLHFFDGEHWLDVPRYVLGLSDAAATVMRPNSDEIFDLRLWGYYSAGPGLYKARIGFYIEGEPRPNVFHDVVAEFYLN